MESKAGTEAHDEELTIEDALDDIFMAKLKFPEISDEIGEFKRLTERQMELQTERDKLDEQIEHLGSDIEENAMRIREYLFNL